jgi:hypothetical protein
VAFFINNSFMNNEIFWVTDEFNNGMRVDAYHNRSNIESIEMTSEKNSIEVIKFVIPYNNYFKRRYDIDLIKNVSKNVFETNRVDLSFIGSKFENTNQILIYGDWHEENEKFKCWLIINKLNAN